MKLAAILALNVAVVGGAILVYDVIRTDSGPLAAPVTADDVDLDRVMDRIAALERRLDGIDTTSERRLSTRLLQLETRVGALDARRAAPLEAALAAHPDHGPAAAPEASAAEEADGPVDEREVARVREALEQVEAERERERATRMVDGLLERLDLSLTDEQRKRLGDELGAFRQSMREHFRTSLAAGIPRDEIRVGMEELRAKLAETLGTFLSASDAEAVSAEIGDRGPGGPGGRGGGFGGGRRN